MNGAHPIDPADPRSVTLTAAEWNVLLQALRNPYQGLIDQIVRQCTTPLAPSSRVRPLTAYEEAS